METVLRHAGLHIFGFLDEASKLQLRATSVGMRRWHQTLGRRMAYSSTSGQRWLRALKSIAPGVQHLVAYPNCLRHLHRAPVARLVSLDVSACGLAPCNVTRLAAALRQARSLRHLAMDRNPCLGSQGVFVVLAALDRAAVRLETLSAVAVGLRSLSAGACDRFCERGVLSSTVEIRLGQDPLDPAFVVRLLEAMPRLRRLLAPLDPSPKAVERLTHVCATDGWDTAAVLASPRAVDLSIAAASLRWDRGVAPTLRRLQLSGVRMDASRWLGFMATLAAGAGSLAGLELEWTDAPAAAVGKLVEAHRNPAALRRLGVIGSLAWTGEDLRLVCLAMVGRGVHLEAWRLRHCPRLAFRGEGEGEGVAAADFAATLDPSRPLSLDLATRHRGLAARGARWLERVLELRPNVVDLDVSGLHAVMEERPRCLGTSVKNLTLNACETNWDLRGCRQLETLSLYDARPRACTAADLCQQAFTECPRLRKLCIDYLRVDETAAFDVALARLPYLHTLAMNWVVAGRGFRDALVGMLEAGGAPALTRLGVQGAEAPWVLSLVRAMRGRRRQCQLMAHGRRWRAAELRLLEAAVRELQQGDLGCLIVSVDPDACVDRLSRACEQAGVVVFPVV